MTGILNTDSCKNIFKKYKILSLPSLFIYELCLYIFKNKDRFLYNKNVHAINTRQKHDFHIPFQRLNVTFNSPNSLGLKVYNKLPLDIKESSTFFEFKKRLKTYLADKCFYRLDEYFCM